MSDKYYRGLRNILNDTKHKLQLASMTLKINENKNNISGIKNDISEINNFSDKIDTNTSSISSNLGKITNNSGLINTNLEKINNIENDIKIFTELYNETFILSNRETTSSSQHIFEKKINFDFSKGGFFNILTTCNYEYDAKYNFSHSYRFYNDKNEVIKREIIPHNMISNVVKDEFKFESIDTSSLKIVIYLVGNHSYKRIKLLSNSSLQFKYNEIEFKIDTNKGNISSNLEKINDIENNLIVFDNIYNETLNIGSFTSISNFLIFFYETINFNFTTNGIIKIDAKYNYFENYNLTHIYKFYKNKEIFKEIKLDNISDIVNDKFEIQAIDSTAIDIGIFYETNTGGNKEIKLVGDNTCRVSYFDNTPKTNKNKLDIASNLSKINNITNNIILKNLYTFIPFYDHDEYDPDGEKNRIPVNRLFFTKTFKMNIKKNDFIELNLRMFLKYEKLDDAHIVDTLIKLIDDDKMIYFIKYRNGNFLAYGKYVFLNNTIIYHFEKDIENLKIEIRFEYESTVFPLGVKKIWHVSRNTTDQWILKHYGN